MPNKRRAGWAGVSLAVSMLVGCGVASLPGTEPEPRPTLAVETGTHWASPDEYGKLRKLNYQFVVTALAPSRPIDWANAFDAAQSAGLQLIAGLYPPPYRLHGGSWEISAEGKAFLRYAAGRAALVKAIFVFNEPYWVNPFTETNDSCGALSAADLRALRVAIHAIWPEARIYHDIGSPSEWAPGGWVPRAYHCVGDKYADARGVADFVGIWHYPFRPLRYERSKGLAALTKEVSYVRTSMEATPIILSQSFSCADCGGAFRWPSPQEFRDWNCAIRRLGPVAISWYPWRQDIYDDYLANHPEIWSLTGPAACQ